MLKCITVGEFATNCYLVSESANNKTLIIDPGAEPEVIAEFIEQNKLNVVGIVNTHGHADHMLGNAYLKKKYSCQLYIHKDDAVLLVDTEKNCSFFYATKVISPAADYIVSENDIITLGKMKFKVLHTPGHTLGSICLWEQDNILLFTGDTLFCGSVGRCDLEHSSEELLQASLRKLIALPKNTKIYPGHGPPTTLANELLHNSFLSLL